MKVYEIKNKYMCSKCGSNHGVMVVEEKSVIYDDERQLLTICGDCLQNLEDYQEERGE